MATRTAMAHLDFTNLFIAFMSLDLRASHTAANADKHDKKGQMPPGLAARTASGPAHCLVASNLAHLADRRSEMMSRFALARAHGSLGRLSLGIVPLCPAASGRGR